MGEQKGRTVKNSNFSAGSFIHINNCGYYENQKLPPKMVRPKGRMDYHLILIDKGTMFFSLNQKMLKLTKNDFLIYAPNTPQLYFFEQDTLYNFYWIHFSGYYIRELLSLCKLNTERSYHVNNACAFIIKDAIKQITSELQTKNYNYEIIASSMLYALFARLPRYMKDSNADSYIKGIVEQFDKDFTTINNINVYARHLGISTTHFIRVFKKYTSLTPKQYIQKARLEKAKSLILNTDMKIHEIALECGFESPLYFSRLFHKYFGVPPTKF